MQLFVLLALLRAASAGGEVDRRLAQAGINSFQNASTPITSSSTQSSTGTSSDSVSEPVTTSSTTSSLSTGDLSPGDQPPTTSTSSSTITSTSSSLPPSDSSTTSSIITTTTSSTSSSVGPSDGGQILQPNATDGLVSPAVVSTLTGRGCDEGCTINAPSGGLDWFWSTVYDFAPSTISLIITDPDPRSPSTIGYSIVMPTDTLNITDLVLSSSSESTSYYTRTTTISGTTYCFTTATTYKYPIPGPTAPVTVPFTQNATIPLPATSTFTPSETFNYADYNFQPTATEVTYPGPDGSSYIQTYPTPFLRFSQYEVVKSSPTRINGAPACVVTTRVYELSDENDVDIALPFSNYDGVSEVDGPLPTAFTSRLRSAQSSCVLGSFEAIPTVYIVVDLVYAIEAALAITASPTSVFPYPSQSPAPAQPPSAPGSTASAIGSTVRSTSTPSAFVPSTAPGLQVPVGGQSVGTTSISYHCVGKSCAVSVSGPHVENPGGGLIVPHTTFNIPAPTPNGQAPLGPSRPPSVDLTPQPVNVNTHGPGARPPPPGPTATSVDEGNGYTPSDVISQISIPGATPAPGDAKVMTLGDMTITADGSNDFVFPDGQTLSPGGTMTFGGQTFSLAPGGGIITLDGQASTLPVETPGSDGVGGTDETGGSGGTGASPTSTQGMGGYIMSGLGDNSGPPTGAAAPNAVPLCAAGRTLLLGAILGFLGL